MSSRSSKRSRRKDDKFLADIPLSSNRRSSSSNQQKANYGLVENINNPKTNLKSTPKDVKSVSASYSFKLYRILIVMAFSASAYGLFKHYFSSVVALKSPEGLSSSSIFVISIVTFVASVLGTVSLLFKLVKLIKTFVVFSMINLGVTAYYSLADHFWNGLFSFDSKFLTEFNVVLLLSIAYNSYVILGGLIVIKKIKKVAKDKKKRVRF